MTTKFYQINGVWNTYQYWHDNYGYTTEPTQSMNFKSSASGTWGTNVNPGYFASPGGYTIDNWSFWSEGIVGWKDIDQLALAGAYPATAIDILLERNGTIANAVYVDDSDELYYLIDGYLSDGWRSWDEVEADGWQVYEGAPPYYMVVNETTGEIVYSISETEENPSMVFSQVGHIEMPDSEMITVYETGVPVQSFYFTSNGRNETENTTLPVDSNIPLYWEDGSLVDDSEGWASEYNGSPVLALTKADMNMFEALPNDKVVSVDHSGTDCLDFYGAGSTQEITIDANFGDAVSIPDGYTIQSVKSTTAYSFPTSITAIDSWNFTVKYGGKDAYSDDITSSDVCVNDLPCLYIFQYVSTSTGYRVSTTPSKYNGNITAITDVSVNSGSNDFVVMTCTAQSSAYAQDIVSHASAYPGYFEYYGSDGNIVAYFFNVPQTLWKFENGLFSWLGDTSSTSDLAYWYNSKTVRIKCVKSVSQSRSAWSALVERIFTLSFTNTQLPGITITLPASETGTSGTTVTLPTMSGEYESGGKTWTPSAWDIGAFGSTYTITGDVIAHLIFEEVPSELTAYFTSAGAAGTEDTFIQNGVTYTLRDSSGVPIPYDPSKTYTKILLYKYDGTEMSPDGVTALDSDQGWCDTVLKVRANGNKYVYKLTYTVS